MRVTTLIALCLTLSVPIANAQIQPETISVETMQDPGQNWFISHTNAGAYIFDATSGEMHGLLSTGGQTAAIEPYGPRGEFYAAESYYSRGVRGERADIVTIFDYENLAVVAEVEIPKKLAVLSMAGHLALTGNGRFIAAFNMTPAQSISIVNVENRSFVGELSTPGCAVMMPIADSDILMICGDGTLQQIQLDDAGNEAGRDRSEVFFSLEDDPVFDRPVESADGWLLLSHKGQAYNVTRDGSEIIIRRPWSIVSDEDIEEKWLPGAYNQVKTVHKDLGLLYVLMHQGEEYSHHESGKEIWVFDMAAQRRIARIELEVPGDNVMVTQEAEPKLIVVDNQGGLHVYDAIKMALDMTIEDAGPGANLLVDF